MHEVRHAGAADAPSLAGVLARAFDDDPVTRFLFPHDARRQRVLPAYFELLLSRAFLPAGEVWTTPDHAGTALWSPPSDRRPGFRDLLRFTPLVPIVGMRTVLAIRVMQAVERHHPRVPHWYLAVLGTEPARQGQGVGSALLEPILRRCDEEALPAYLESSKERNVPFYARHGFEVTGELDLPGGGPHLWLMWREPRAT